jgi:hypothetical protein
VSGERGPANPPPSTQFPWDYVKILALPVVAGPVISLLLYVAPFVAWIAYVVAAVALTAFAVGVGALRLMAGEARTRPALRWLVPIALLTPWTLMLAGGEFFVLLQRIFG